jgi:PAS domain S-box-containing protein
LRQDLEAAKARSEATVADLEMQLKEQAERMQASEREAAVRLTASEQRVSEMRAAKDRATASIAQLEDQLRALRQDLEAAKRRGEVLRATAERLPVLEKEIDDVRAETHRQFEENPASWFRCRRSGEIIHANRAMRNLVGYEPLELQQLDFGETVFESANDFRWVLDRCLESLSTQSMETPWRRKDGRRLIVRVVAVPATAESVDVIAEDVTHVRELEEKLRNAQRMESVARYGSEVAVTCQGLLTHVKEEGQQWLAALDSDTVRYRGELLLDEVTRAMAYLGQLAAYSEEQQSIPDLVDVNKVLRDLEPVLKRVAGDNIDIVLPKLSSPLNLDVEPRPVERMLVNVAAYGRERMPLGGRLKIELDSVVVDREFVAKHPHVRPGEHVLLIVNEQRRVIRPNSGDLVPTGSSAVPSFTGDSPGVDLGTLQALVTECGGHLWMRAEPPGDMELKIHLPRRMLDRLEAPAPAMPSGRSRWIRRAFGARH